MPCYVVSHYIECIHSKHVMHAPYFFSFPLLYVYIGNGKGKAHPITGNESLEVE